MNLDPEPERATDLDAWRSVAQGDAEDRDAKVWPDDYGWGDLMTLLDEHWPADIFGGTHTPLDNLRGEIKHDAGVRIVALLRWLDAAHKGLQEAVDTGLGLSGEICEVEDDRDALAAKCADLQRRVNQLEASETRDD